MINLLLEKYNSKVITLINIQKKVKVILDLQELLIN